MEGLEGIVHRQRGSLGAVYQDNRLLITPTSVFYRGVKVPFRGESVPRRILWYLCTKADSWVGYEELWSAVFADSDLQYGALYAYVGKLRAHLRGVGETDPKSVIVNTIGAYLYRSD